ncbi:MAG: hypothetical protein ACREDV_03515, partial [Methylocella sp.]
SRGHSVARLPLAGKSVLIIEDEVLIALGVETCLRDAGADVVKIATSKASAQTALDEGILFDGAIVDLKLADGDAGPLVRFLSERGIFVVITTGYDIDMKEPAFGRVIAILEKPYTGSDLITAFINAFGRAIN